MKEAADVTHRRVDIEAEYNHDGAVEYREPGSCDAWGHPLWEDADDILRLYPEGATLHTLIVDGPGGRNHLRAWVEIPQ